MRFGGRWHHPGTRVVYTSASLALAALETFVNLDPDECADEFVALAADLRDFTSILHISPDDLPAHWDQHPSPSKLRNIGTGWARDSASLALAVPSAVIPTEWNYLLNVGHPEFSQIVVHAARPFRFDPRMLK